MNDKKSRVSNFIESDSLDDLRSEIISTDSDSKKVRSKTRKRLHFFKNRDLQDNVYYKDAEKAGGEHLSDFKKLPTPVPLLPIGRQEHLSNYDNRKTTRRRKNRNNKDDHSGPRG